MQTYTIEELKVVLYKHALWRQGDTLGERATLSGADLRHATLSGADLRGADLSGADLSGADLRGADLRYADLCGADLSGADLRGADLCGADLSGADLLCSGNKSEIKSLQIEKWDISYTHYTLQIGCQTHLISKWRKWDTPAGLVWVASMDDEAVEWAKRLLPLVLQIIDVSPAKGQSHEH